MVKKRKQPTPLRLRAYQAIKTKIINLEFKPGEKISENRIAQELNVSRTPVREALLMLEHEKIVVCTEGFGFAVRRFTMQDIEEYYALRSIIEDFAMTLVIQKITDEEIAGLHENIAQGKKSIKDGDIKAIIRCESEFHELLYRATKSEILLDTISGLTEKFHWFRSLALSMPGAASNALTHHEQMIELIEKKDTEGLKQSIHRHLGHAQERVQGLLKILL